MTKYSNIPARIQITVFHRLVIDAIVQNFAEADSLWAKWAVLRYRRNEPMGGASISRADAPRMWDVPVGQSIPAKLTKWTR